MVAYIKQNLAKDLEELNRLLITSHLNKSSTCDHKHQLNHVPSRFMINHRKDHLLRHLCDF